jgi:hypothetical protein
VCDQAGWPARDETIRDAYMQVMDGGASDGWRALRDLEVRCYVRAGTRRTRV